MKLKTYQEGGGLIYTPFIPEQTAVSSSGYSTRSSDSDEDKIDPVSGIIIHKKSGDFVNKNDIIFELHHNKTDIDNVTEILNSSYTVSNEKTEQNKKIKYIVN